MLADLVINDNQFLVLLDDDIGVEKFAHRFMRQLLSEKTDDQPAVKVLQTSKSLQRESTLIKFVTECSKKDCTWNVILPPLSDLLCCHRPAVIFSFLQKLRRNGHVRHVMLWMTRPNLVHCNDYVIAAFEHMADVVLQLKTPRQLSILNRKPGGGVTYKHYVYKMINGEFVTAVAVPANVDKEEEQPNVLPQKPDELGTFKIELDEDELLARNALKLPYERTSDNTTQSNVIYNPDASDDIDDEDPDEDLCI